MRTWSAPRLVSHLNVESFTEETDDAQEVIHRGTDHRDPGRAGTGHVDGGGLPSARRQLCDLLQVEGEVRRPGRV